MNDVNFIVLITTHNNVDEIDKTVASVKNQDLPQEDIWLYIVDFESSDGTYEKILSYDRYHTAVFQIPDVYHPCARNCRAIELVNTQVPPAVFHHLVSLKPGDILYENCFSASEEIFSRYRAQGVSLVLCEADIADRSGNVYRQPEVADREICINTLNYADLLLENFSFHYAGYLGGNISPTYRDFMGNERRFWNKAVYSLPIGAKLVYSPQVLLCLKEWAYPDEEEELLFRWSQVIGLQRGVQGQLGYGVELHQSRVNRNLANYALWRISKRYSDLTMRERENLLLLAGIIDPEIETEKIYGDFREKIAAGKEVIFSDYQDYFEKEHQKSRKNVEP